MWDANDDEYDRPSVRLRESLDPEFREMTNYIEGRVTESLYRTRKCSMQMNTRVRAWMLGSSQDIGMGATDGHKGNGVDKDVCKKNAFITYTKHIF